MADRVIDRFAVGVLENIGRLLWGFTPRLMPFVVAQLGAVRALIWFVANMPRYERTLRTLGAQRTHLACLAISLSNGCRYCSFGHAYALELLYLQERGELFPVDARILAGWLRLPPTALRNRLREVLQQAGMHAEVLWVDRTLGLAAGTLEPIDSDEARIAHLVRMFAVLNSAGISGQAVPDEAHDPVNKDTDLKSRHAALRGAHH
jgi:hypothetical protein